MRIIKIRIQNFRLLVDTTVDLEKNLSLILGKNNCGKTSFLLALDRFLGHGSGKSSFAFDDLSMSFKDYLKHRIEDASSGPPPGLPQGISLKVFIEYEEGDDLSNIGNNVIMDLDINNRMIVLAFEYHTSEENILQLRQDFNRYLDEKKAKAKGFFDYLKEHHAKYFNIAKKSILYDLTEKREKDEVFTDLINEQIRIDRIINFKWVSAKRKVSNKDSDQALSSLSAQIYKKLDATSRDAEARDDFKELLSETDAKLNKVYDVLFKEVLEDVKSFGGIKKGDSIIRIVSSLQHRELLEENTTVMYGLNVGDHSLPENYNGLGYMSLISLIFEIKLAQHEFEKDDETPSDINLLFVEEPEVHTHPQMQCVFIKNIKALLKVGVKAVDGRNRGLQTIITTHSSHIVAESNFDDIKYFKRINNSIHSKNLKELEAEYGERAEYYKFLKQYLTLDRSDLFFADKAIFVEGDTERILLPAMMKKLDQDDFVEAFRNDEEPEFLPLHSQNISLIEVGAYSQVFEKFMDFIGVKSVIITDIDSTHLAPVLDKQGKPKLTKAKEPRKAWQACPVAVGIKTSNTSLRFFFGEDIELSALIAMTVDKKTLKKDKDSKAWVQDPSGHLRCAFQIEIGSTPPYHPRSFEDGFFHANREFFKARLFDDNGVYIGAQTFTTLPEEEATEFCQEKIGPYEIAEEVTSKPSFAMEILINSTEVIEKLVSKSGKEMDKTIDFANWKTPEYIREALAWLKRD
jgi:putative ATP-dependent endonuclease of OLD family